MASVSLVSTLEREKQAVTVLSWDEYQHRVASHLHVVQPISADIITDSGHCCRITVEPKELNDSAFPSCIA